jgi:hypothetical protein
MVEVAPDRPECPEDRAGARQPVADDLGCTMSQLAIACKSFPIGATILRDGVNFSVYSRSATGMELAALRSRR